MVYRSRSRSRVSFLVVLGTFLAVAGVAGAGYVGYRMLSAPQPSLALAGPFDKVGRGATLALKAKDASGLRRFKVVVSQGTESFTLIDESYAPPRPETELRWSPSQERRFKLKEGPGRIVAEARNASWGDFFRGRTTTLSKEFTARFVPPRLEVLSAQHYVNQGGCDMVVYKVTPPDADSGVQVGDRLFPGFALPNATDASVRFAVFAFPYDVPANTPVRLRAWDEAGNESLAGFWLKVFPKSFRTRTLDLDDSFLNKVVPEILSQSPSLGDPGDLLKSYLLVNRDLRKANNEELARLAERSQERFLWTQPFQQLSNSQVEAQFADHRSYRYQGKEVDRQDHLGYDLATTARAPVAAANDGVVMKSEYFGIYGNTVVIDHGYGLLSLYGHLSSFAVKPGDSVAKGQIIGNSGATGLAGGDHLHFSMVLHGAQVDAKEWWDPHWIGDRMTAKLKEFGSARPSAAESPR